MAKQHKTIDPNPGMDEETLRKAHSSLMALLGAAEQKVEEMQDMLGDDGIAKHVEHHRRDIAQIDKRLQKIEQEIERLAKTKRKAKTTPHKPRFTEGFK